MSLPPPVVEIGEHAQPVMRALLVGQIKPQQFFLPFDVQAENGIDRFAGVTAVFLDLIVDGIQPHNGVNRVQVPLTPGLEFREQLVGDGIQSAIRHVDTVQVLDV